MITEKNESHIDKVPSAGETERTRNIKVYIPNVDILEQKNAIVLIADMPGINENSVHVTLERNVLTIKGDVETDHYKGYTLTHAEYGIGDSKTDAIYGHECAVMSWLSDTFADRADLGVMTASWGTCDVASGYGHYCGGRRRRRVARGHRGC